MAEKGKKAACRHGRLSPAESTNGRMGERTERSRGGQWRAGRNLAGAGQVVYTNGRPFAFRVKIIAFLFHLPPTRPFAVRTQPSLIYEQHRSFLSSAEFCRPDTTPNYPPRLSSHRSHRMGTGRLPLPLRENDRGQRREK